MFAKRNPLYFSAQSFFVAIIAMGDLGSHAPLQIFRTYSYFVL